MFALMFSMAMKALESCLKEETGDERMQEFILAISESSTFVRQLMTTARTPIPLIEAADLKGIERLCADLTQVIGEMKNGLPPLLDAQALTDWKQLCSQMQSAHVDDCMKAMQIFRQSNGSVDISSAIAWLNSQSSTDSETIPSQSNGLTSSKAMKLSQLGFSIDICELALEMCDQDETLASNWLVEHGQSARRSGQSPPPLVEKQTWGEPGSDVFHESVRFELISKESSDEN